MRNTWKLVIIKPCHFYRKQSDNVAFQLRGIQTEFADQRIERDQLQERTSILQQVPYKRIYKTKSILSQIGWNHTNPYISWGKKNCIISKQNSRFVVIAQWNHCSTPCKSGIIFRAKSEVHRININLGTNDGQLFKIVFLLLFIIKLHGNLPEYI